MEGDLESRPNSRYASEIVHLGKSDWETVLGERGAVQVWVDVLRVETLLLYQ